MQQSCNGINVVVGFVLIFTKYNDQVRLRTSVVTQALVVSVRLGLKQLTHSPQIPFLQLLPPCLLLLHL